MYKLDKLPKIAIVIGTRAQLIKMSAIIMELQYRSIQFELIFTNQHQLTMNKIINQFGLKKPDINFFREKNQNEAKTMGLIWCWSLKSIFKIIFNQNKIMRVHNGGIVLVHGDTNSTWIGALLGKIRRNKVMHIESGLRSFNLLNPFPEEINRIITFKLTDVYVCPNEWACNNLKNYKGIKINTFANTQYDVINMALNNIENIDFSTPKGNYAVCSIHRYENVFKKENLLKVLNIIETISKKIQLVFVLYPITKKRLIRYGLIDNIRQNKNIVLQERLSFFEYMKLQYNSEFVVTDGGSIQEELSYMGKPTLLLRDVTERIEGVDETAVISRFNFKIINDFLKNYKRYEHEVKQNNHSPSKIIVDWLENNGYA